MMTGGRIMKQSIRFGALVLVLLFTGCATSSWEAGYWDGEDHPDDPSGHPASLVEIKFGGGEAEVTKNLPGDAARGVGSAIKTMRGKAPAENIGE
jgi:hypothetical protein